MILDGVKTLLNHNEKVRTSTGKLINRKAYLLKLKVYELLGNCCFCCGERNEEFLTIDHVNNDGWKERQFGRSPGVASYYTILKAGANLKDYRILCYNCNCSRHRRQDKKCVHEIIRDREFMNSVA